MTSRNMCKTAAFGLVAAAGLASATISFGPGFTLAAAQRPGASAIADFNGDGMADLAITTDNPDKITVYTNAGNGAFTGPVSFQTGAGTGADSILAQDMDGDGDNDLVVALHNVNSVRVFTNNGGAFAGGASAPTGGDPRGMAKGDLDGDGDADFATANRDGNSITVLLANGASLASATTAVGNEPRAVAIAQFVGGGLNDIAVTSHDDRTVRIMQNNGGGSFTQAASLFVGGAVRPDGIAAADVDGDGDMDLGVATSNDGGPNWLAIFTNTGGSFTGPVNYATLGENPGPVAAADLDADGDADFAVANEGGTTVAVLENLGGTFGAAVLLSAGLHPGHIAFGNIDEVGTPDMVVTNRDGNTVSVFRNLVEDQEPCAADFDGDGFVTGADFDAYVAAFESGDATSDFDGDGFVTGLDFDAFVQAFEAGC